MHYRRLSHLKTLAFSAILGADSKIRGNAMKRLLIVPLILILSASAVRAAPTIPAELRGGIETTQVTINKALAIQKDGWVYVMPMPKSPQAAWSNTDGRTTWWNGYWINKTTKQYSSTEPSLKDGKYVGDGVDVSGWRRGGSPRSRPSEIEWLLSKSGGIVPKGQKTEN